MTLAVWALVVAVFFLAAAVLAVTWAYLNDSRLDAPLTEEEIARSLAPLTAMTNGRIEHDVEEPPELA